jgi:hypothetical protein
MSIPSLSTYGSYQRQIGYAGELVDQNPFESESLMNDQAVAVQFGTAVARSAADNTCKAPAADADKIIGVALRHAIMPTSGASVGGTNAVQYNQNIEVPVLRQGFVYVVAYENVTRGDAAISITAQNGQIGGTTGGAPGAGRVAIPGGTWETTTAAGAVGIVRINN